MLLLDTHEHRSFPKPGVRRLGRPRNSYLPLTNARVPGPPPLAVVPRPPQQRTGTPNTGGRAPGGGTAGKSTGHTYHLAMVSRALFWWRPALRHMPRKLLAGTEFARAGRSKSATGTPSHPVPDFRLGHIIAFAPPCRLETAGAWIMSDLLPTTEARHTSSNNP